MRLGTSPESGRSAMRVMLTLLLASAGLLALATEGPHFAADRPLDMEHIRLELSVDMAQRQVDGVATLRMTPLRSVTSVKLDAVDFDTRAVTLAVDDQAITTPRCANDGQSIEVFLDPPATPGQKLVVTIRYALHDPKSGLHFFAPTSDEPDAPYQVWSQGETSDNRYWIPCLDQPNERQTSEIIATVDAQYQVLSNGRLIAHHAAEEVGQTIYHWVQDKPHPAYLITLVIGKFHVQEERWCDVPITYWVPPERQADVAATFGNTPRMLEFFSDRLGVKYPWDQYAQVCCYQFSGGMENTSATTLAMDTLCDATARLDGGSDPLIAHELAHQWFGDLLTCREWPQLWLNEGFATYFETLWTEYDLGPDEFAYSLYQKAQEALAGDKDGPVVERYYDTTWQLFNPRSYSKGGWILHMLRCQLGDDVFFTALRRYCTTYAGGSVETADFRRTLEETSGRSLGRFFYDWVERPGHPNLDVTYAWHEEDKEAEVVVRQTPTPANDPQARPAEPFQFPLTLELETGPEAAPVVVTQRIAAREATLLVPLPQRPTMVRVDPAYTVLMDLAEHKGRDLWISQLTRDPHPVGRLRALQALVALEKAPRPVTPPLQQAVALAALPATEGLIRDVLADALRTEKFWAVRCELARCVGELGGPAARDALIDALRSEQPRVRTAGLEALRAFRDDATVAAAVRDILVQGDPSERVLSAAATTHAAMSADDTIPLFRTLLERDGQREAVRQRVLKLLGERAEAAGLDLLMEWTPAGRPRACRQTAIAALARAAKQVAAAAPESDVLARLPGVLITALQDDDARVRIAAAHAAAELGPRAAESQEALAAIAAHDPSEAARRAAQEALQKIK